MDRSAALTHLGMVLLFILIAGAAWLAESPLARYRTLVMAPGEAPVMQIPLDDPVFDDPSALLTASLVEGLRRAPLLMAVVSLLTHLFLWHRSDPRARRPFRERAAFTLGPMGLAAAIGAVVFTPPDMLSSLLMILVQGVLAFPAALLLLIVISRRRSRHHEG